MSAYPQTELHRHLDVSLRLATLLKLAQARGLESQGTSLEAFRAKIVLAQPLHDLKSVLATFELFQRVFDRPEVCEQVAFEAIEDAYREGTRKIEYRFSLGFVSEFSKMSWEDALRGFEAGRKKALEKYPEMQVGFLCIATRDYGVDSVAETVDFFLAHRANFVGVDLAGNEVGFPCRMFETPFKKAQSAGAAITIHAGEGSGPENVWEAIDLLGARRIGHGIQSVRDPQLMAALAKRNVCLEVCPTSNWLTRAVPSLAAHPLPKLLRSGVPVSVNTDDPAVFGVTLPSELKIAREMMGLSETEVELCRKFASEASFIPA